MHISSMDYKYKFTVFTPCYNSEKFLHRVFESLKNQTFRDFEWLVINDASTDNTHNLIESFISEADFPVRYFNLTKNQMLTRNYNLAIREAQGELFLPAGHDDEFIPNTLQVFLDTWEKYRSDDIAGVSCLCVDQHGDIVGDRYPTSPYLSNYIDTLYNEHISGEKWGFMRTDLMKQYLLPEDIDTYISEGLMWIRMGKDYKTIHINEPLRIYYMDQPEHSSLSSVNTSKIKYPRGTRYYTLEMINEFKQLIKGNLRLKLKLYINYIRLSLTLKIPIGVMINEVTYFTDKVITLLLFPVGFFVFYRDKSRSDK